MFRSFVPERFGGYEIGLDLFVDIGILVSEACPSTGWITTFYMEHNWQLVHFSDELQEEVLGGAPFILAPGAVNPTGATAAPTHGGARVPAAETVLRVKAAGIERHARGENMLSNLDKLETRLAIAHVVRHCNRVVRHVMEGSGASAHFLDHELQRINRDVQMIGAHTIFDLDLDLDLAAKQSGPARVKTDAQLFSSP